jgi:hypothetical protein
MPFNLFFESDRFDLGMPPIQQIAVCQAAARHLVVAGRCAYEKTHLIAPV